MKGSEKKFTPFLFDYQAVTNYFQYFFKKDLDLIEQKLYICVEENKKRIFNYYLEKRNTMYSLNIHTTINNTICNKKQNGMVELCISKNGSDELI